MLERALLLDLGIMKHFMTDDEEEGIWKKIRRKKKKQIRPY